MTLVFLINYIARDLYFSVTDISMADGCAHQNGARIGLSGECSKAQMIAQQTGSNHNARPVTHVLVYTYGNDRSQSLAWR